MVSATVHLASQHITLGPSAQDLAFLLAASTHSSDSNDAQQQQQPPPFSTPHAALPLVLSERFDSLLDPPPVLVSGHVRLTGVTKTSTTSNISVVQVALVGWERESHPANPGVKKELVNERVVLWSKDNAGAGARRLADGCHEFPFSIPLPADVPPTLKVQYGQIAYKLVVTLHRAVLFPLKFTHPVIVRRCVPTIRRSIGNSDESTTMSKPFAEEESNCSRVLSSPRQRPVSPPPSPSLHLFRNDDSDYHHNHFLFAPHLQRESFTGPTAASEFAYTVTVPRAIFRTKNNNSNAKNNTHIIMLHLAPNTHPLSTIRALECTIVERRSFRSSIVPSRELPTLAPTVEEEVLTRPAVRYKLALPSHDDDDDDDESGNERETEEDEAAASLACGQRSMPFVMSIGDDATVDVSTPTLAISHVVRIVVEYEPAGLASESSPGANSMWRTTRGRGSGDAKKTRVTIEIPIYIADALDDEDNEDDCGIDAASSLSSGGRMRLAVTAPASVARRPTATTGVLPSPPPSP
ncbi:hypothetical protein BDZ88DRAFT_508690 [Geranomyces variabilis]|nr:hypothetical protein BDZ88DRAFT_508690 [Geranomyces variabilis]KAJ3135886.1 hypothetical protein HDU90_003627 [Geranomyces variabilis]